MSCPAFNVGDLLTLCNPAVGVPAEVEYRGTTGGGGAVVVFMENRIQATVRIEWLSPPAPRAIASTPGAIVCGDLDG